jgi:dihydrolipoamide dehydrogenase
MACIYAAFGCKVTIIEALDSLLPAEDEWVGRILSREFKKLGIEVLTKQKVTKVEKNNGSAQIILESGKTIEAQKVLVCVGRKATCDNETIQALGLEMDGPVIKVNKKFETSVSGVYALGDVAGTTYLAHGATVEADIAAINAAELPQSVPAKRPARQRALTSRLAEDFSGQTAALWDKAKQQVK